MTKNLKMPTEKVEVLLIGGIQELQELLSIRVPLAIGLVFLDL